MDAFSPTDLKSILHSKRANLYYLQHCRVLVNGGRVEYVTDEGSQSRYWNIPIANTTSACYDGQIDGSASPGTTSPTKPIAPPVVTATAVASEASA